MDSIKNLAESVKRAKRIVFFGGAGVSTESGIPDFRSGSGVFKQHQSAERMLSYSYFKENPAEFTGFYRKYLIFPDVQPNYAHIYLAGLEQAGKLTAVITQNIDGLHQAAGTINVIELHGSAHRAFCDACKQPHPSDTVNLYEKATDIPYCKCGGVIRPAIIMYEEQLDGHVIKEATEAISRADLLIIAGTSLRVYPAAGLVNFFKGDTLTVINREPLPTNADIIIKGSVGETFKLLNSLHNV